MYRAASMEARCKVQGGQKEDRSSEGPHGGAPRALPTHGERAVAEPPAGKAPHSRPAGLRRGRARTRARPARQKRPTPLPRDAPRPHISPAAASQPPVATRLPPLARSHESPHPPERTPLRPPRQPQPAAAPRPSTWAPPRRPPAARSSRRHGRTRRLRARHLDGSLEACGLRARESRVSAGTPQQPTTRPCPQVPRSF